MSCDHIGNGQLSGPSLRCSVSEERNWIDLRRNLLQQRRFPIDSLQQEREEKSFLSVSSCLGFVGKFVSLLYTCDTSHIRTISFSVFVTVTVRRVSNALTEPFAAK